MLSNFTKLLDKLAQIEISNIKQIQKHCTEWERSFLNSVIKNIETKKSHSEKQEFWYKKIVNKYPNPNKNVAIEKKEIQQKLEVSKLTPRKWQKEAFQKWLDNDMKGLIKSATGTGKTYVGKMAIEYLMKKCLGKIFVVVPTIHLQSQWAEKIKKTLGLRDEDIGFIGGGHTPKQERQIQICIVNSIRFMGLVGNVILDEVHRYLSEHNFKFLENGSFTSILGLSATPERGQTMSEDLKIKQAFRKLISKAPIIYEYSPEQAIDDGTLSKFTIVNIGIGLTIFEQEEYDKMNIYIKNYFPDFNYDFNKVKSSIGPTPEGGVAAQLMRNFTQRKHLLVNAKGRVQKAILLILNELEKGSKIIVFTELIKTADQIQKLLKEKSIKSAKYHSNMVLKEKQQMLQDFRDDKFKILIAVKALDEGIDVPSCNVGIMVAGSSVERQMIQRLGRILRKKDIPATLYQLYIIGTKDEDWMRERSKNLLGIAEEVVWK